MRILNSNDYILNFLNRALTIGIGILSSSFLNRYLGVELKGEYSYINNVVQMIALFLNLGIYQSYSYNYRRKVDNIKQLYSNIFILQFFVNSLVFLFIYILNKGLSVELIAIVVPFNILLIQYEGCMLVENIRFKIKVNIINSIFKLIFSLFIYLFMPRGLILPIGMILVVDMFTILMYIKKLKVIPNPFCIEFNFLKEVVKFGFFPMMTSLLVTMNYNIDTIFLKHSVSPYELGLYTTGTGLATYAWIIPDTFKEVLFSRVAREEGNKSINLSIKLSLYAIFLVILGVIFGGKLALRILYGKEFINAYKITIILFLGIPSMIFFKIIGVLYIAQGRRIFNFIVLLISVIINVVFNIILIPLYGIYGAAIASIFSYSICGITFLWSYCKSNNVAISKLFIFRKGEIKYLLKRIVE